MSIYAVPGMRSPVFLGMGRGSATRFADAGEITHGFQINTLNTGVNAYFDPTLGRKLTNADLTVHSGSVTLSSIATARSTVSKRWFQGGITIDVQDVNFVACRFDQAVSTFFSGTDYRLNMSWCSVDSTTPNPAGVAAVGYNDYNLTRCYIAGEMDGLKAHGGCNITECYIRTKTNAPDDHNDGIQSTASYMGNIVRRCNIDANPVNGWNPDTGGPNGALFVADSSNGLMQWYDNYLAGGVYTIRCHEDCTYNVQGNWVLAGSYAFGPASRAVIPQSNLTWGTLRPNIEVNASGVQQSVIDVP